MIDFKSGKEVFTEEIIDDIIWIRRKYKWRGYHEENHK